MLPVGNLKVLTSQQVILAGEDDTANVASALRLLEFHAGQQGQRVLPPCHIHLFNLHMRQLFARYRLFESNSQIAHLSTFNVYDNCARDLLEKCHLDRITIGAESKSVVRLIVLGFGRMGESLVLQAAKLGHFANAQPLEIVVFDREAEEREKLFRYRYRHFDKICCFHEVLAAGSTQSADSPESSASVGR
jgi:hypothetical protein